ncbi:MAG TPA: hypothetical protein ENJ08_02830 [Gammaproteobacteria bacterium]|nr:hypothetical protein [Gammaproteobacteria bacterium]
MEIISIIKDISLSIASLTTAAVAYNGVGKWHRELKGKASFETARALIQATYKLRDAIEQCRSPYIHTREFPDDYHSLSTQTPEQKGDAYAQVYGARWQRISETMLDFDAFSLESEALWGVSIKEKTDMLRDCVIELHQAIDAYISNEYSNGSDFKDTELSKHVNTRLSNHMQQENPFTAHINNAIKEIETEVRPHLDRS